MVAGSRIKEGSLIKNNLIVQIIDRIVVLFYLDLTTKKTYKTLISN